MTKRVGLTRRGALKGMAATAAISPLPVRAFAQDVTLRWWSPQGAPAQREAYQFQIAQFEAMRPRRARGVRDDLGRRLCAAAGRRLLLGRGADIVTHLPSFAVQSYYANGLIEPINDVINAIGPRNTIPARTTSSAPPTASTAPPASATRPPTCCGCARPDAAPPASTRSPKPGTNCAPPARRCRRAASTARRCPMAATR
jgi:hypothetical protein